MTNPTHPPPSHTSRSKPKRKVEPCVRPSAEPTRTNVAKRDLAIGTPKNGDALQQSFGAAILNSAIGLVVADARGRFLNVNQSACNILGYSEKELLSRDWFSIIHPGNQESKEELSRGLKAQRHSEFVVETRCIRKNGVAVWVRNSISPFFGNNGGRNFAFLVQDMERDISERKRAEDTLRESEGRLRLALESGRMYAFEWDCKTDVIRRSAECAAVPIAHDYPLEDTGRDLLARLHPADRARYVEVLKEMSPAQPTYVVLYRKQLSDGSTCWIEVRGRGFFDANGELARVMGIASDATARKKSEEALRKLSARLIDAQEEERKRFARELHDGVSQTLALISSEVGLAANACTTPELSSILNRVYAKLQDVASDISHLSHELHPTTLKHLGLTAAIRFLCREVSEGHGIDVEFVERGDPQQRSKPVALCLYRVAQEALQNVVKHSGSKKACVELRTTADEITLCVVDKGVGFDTRSQKSGLGLVSMRERLRLVGGKIAISSRRNCGTRIEASVPLTPMTIKTAA